MEFDKYIKVYTLSSYKEANRHLEIGWKLLFVGQYADEESKHPTFVVGWPEDAGNPKDPQDAYGTPLI